MNQTLPNILFIARQAGSAAAFTPVIKELKEGYSCELLAFEHAHTYWENQQLISTKISCFEDVEFILKPDIIVSGTSLKTNDDNKFWEYAKKNNIPSIGFVDSWCSYWQRFSSNINTSNWDYTPDIIATIDDFMSHKLIQYGAPERKLMVTGSPSFDSLIDQYQRSTVNNLKKDKKILLVMDPLMDLYGEQTISKIGYTEYQFLTDSLQTLVDIAFKGTIELRLHPREALHKYDHLIQTYKSLNISVSDVSKNKIESLQEADLVIGMNSILLYEAGVVGKNVWSYQINAVEVSDIILNRPFIKIISKASDIPLAIESEEQAYHAELNKSSLTNLIKAKIHG